MQTTLRLLSALLALLAGCTPQPAPPPDPKTRFRGVQLQVVTPRSDELAAWLNDQRGEWSAETGGEVQLVGTESSGPPKSPADGNGAAAGSLGQPSGDILIYPSTDMGSLARAFLLVEVPKDVLDAAAYERKDIAPAVHDQLIAWERRAHALPLAAFCQLVYYRSDLFADGSHRKKFEEKFGHVLAPPATWLDFDEIAEFFDGLDLDGDGRPDRSVAVADPAEALVSRAAAYGKHPENFSFYFDVGSFAPLVAGPPFQEAMREWVRVGPFLANDRKADAELATFQHGQAVLALGSSALARRLLQPASAAGRSKIAGKVGCAPLPGSPRVYAHDKQTWIDLPAGKLNRSAVVEGLVASVLRTSRHTDAAYDFLTFLTGRERSLTSVTAREFGLGPYRLSHLVDTSAWIAMGWPADESIAYLSAMRQSLSESNAVARLRIDGADEYYQALGKEVAVTLRGERPSVAALDAVPEAWKTITERRDPGRQRRQYRYSLGMPVID
jgi:multiple sugar transport system substrate-binding protein